jgi:hypothetical protein
MGRKSIGVAGGVLLVAIMLGMVGSGLASAGPGISTGARIQFSERPDRITDYLAVRPIEGPAGTEVRIQGHVAYSCYGTVPIHYVDAAQVDTLLGTVPVGDIDLVANIPTGAALGAGQVRAWHLLYSRFYRRCIPSLAAQTSFTVTNGPGIFGFTPRSGPVGTVVTLKGIRFTGATKVKFNGTLSAFTVVSDTKIKATVPAGATTGAIKIVTPIGNAVSGPDFEVT